MLGSEMIGGWGCCVMVVVVVVGSFIPVHPSIFCYGFTVTNEKSKRPAESCSSVMCFHSHRGRVSQAGEGGGG